MTISAINESQRKAARVVGFSYLFAMATAVFAELYVRDRLIVPDDAAETARNTECLPLSAPRDFGSAVFLRS
jgi:hypothetical protein